MPLLALLRRRLSDDEVAAVATELAARGQLNIDVADIGAAITRITDEPPSPADLERVQRELEAIGWPLDRDPERHVIGDNHGVCGEYRRLPSSKTDFPKPRNRRSQVAQWRIEWRPAIARL
jgi:hypothetical protein